MESLLNSLNYDPTLLNFQVSNRHISLNASAKYDSTSTSFQSSLSVEFNGDNEEESSKIPRKFFAKSNLEFP